MFIYQKPLQFAARPDAPDPLMAKRLQELIGGQMGEMTVAMQYLFQGWNARGPAKYRDMLLSIGTEELCHIEMLATMVGRLLEDAPLEAQEEAVAGDAAVAAVMGGMNPQHAIVAGLGALPAASTGVPWMGSYIIASGNLLADFRSNLHAESHGRIQASRIYAMTTDAGVRDMLGVLIARDAMHQRQWLAAIAELEADGLEETIVPGRFPEDRQRDEVASTFYDFAPGGQASEGSWASGRTPDGRREFRAEPAQPSDDIPHPPPGDERLFNTPRPMRRLAAE